MGTKCINQTFLGFTFLKIAYINEKMVRDEMLFGKKKKKEREKGGYLFSLVVVDISGGIWY